MGRKRPIPDLASAGKSGIVPYRRGEDFRTRHARRLTANLEQEATVRRWCQQRGLTLRIKNGGHLGRSPAGLSWPILAAAFT